MEKRVDEGLEPFEEITPEQDARIQAMIAQADEEIERRRATGDWEPDEDTVPVESGPAARVPDEVRVNLRWPRRQLDAIKKAAELFGMPYQTYLKEAAFRQALDDLEKVKYLAGKSNPAVETRGERLTAFGGSEQVETFLARLTAGIRGSTPSTSRFLQRLRESWDKDKSMESPICFVVDRSGKGDWVLRFVPEEALRTVFETGSARKEHRSKESTITPRPASGS